MVCCSTFYPYLIYRLSPSGDLRPALQIAATDFQIGPTEPLPSGKEENKNTRPCRLLLVGPSPCGVCALDLYPSGGAQVGEQSAAPSSTPSARLTHIYAGNSDYNQIVVLIVRVFHFLPAKVFTLSPDPRLIAFVIQSTIFRSSLPYERVLLFDMCFTCATYSNIGYIANSKHYYLAS